MAKEIDSDKEVASIVAQHVAGYMQSRDIQYGSEEAESLLALASNIGGDSYNLALIHMQIMTGGTDNFIDDVLGNQ